MPRSADWNKIQNDSLPRRASRLWCHSRKRGTCARPGDWRSGSRLHSRKVKSRKTSRVSKSRRSSLEHRLSKLWSHGWVTLFVSFVIKALPDAFLVASPRPPPTPSAPSSTSVDSAEAGVPVYLSDSAQEQQEVFPTSPFATPLHEGQDPDKEEGGSHMENDMARRSPWSIDAFDCEISWVAELGQSPHV